MSDPAPNRGERRRQERQLERDGDAPGLFYADAQTFDPVDVIAEGLTLLRDGQGADRVSLRTIEYLYAADGAPLLNEYGNQRRKIYGGTFNDDRRAAECAAKLNAAGAHIYAHVQRTGAPITNAMLAGNIATVRTDGVTAYVTLFIDLDAEPDAEPGVAIYVAHELVTVLVDVGVPRGAIMVNQSGRGAYVMVAIEPQPLTARPVMQLALQTIGRMVRAAEEPVHVDEGVFDAARIARVPGTANLKADADPATPCWTLTPWTPGVRCPWSLIEKIASKSRPKLRVVARTRKQHPESGSCERRPLRDLFVDRGWFYRERADGIADVKCPNHAQHTDGRDSAILYPPSKPGGAGWLKCSHSHCASLTLFDVFRLLEGRA